MMSSNPDRPRVRRPCSPPVRDDGVRSSGRYVVIEGSLHTVTDWEPNTLTHVEVFGRQHPGEGRTAIESGDVPPVGGTTSGRSYPRISWRGRCASPPTGSGAGSACTSSASTATGTSRSWAK